MINLINYDLNMYTEMKKNTGPVRAVQNLIGESQTPWRNLYH